MSRFALTAFALLFSAVVCFSGSTPSGSNEYVAFSASLTPPLHGKPAALRFDLRPKRGIHINLDPPISISFDSASPAIAAGKPEIPRMEKLPYLDTTKAIVQRVTLSRPSGKDPAMLKGTLTYFYCSDAEGWCSRFKQPFALTLPAAK